jgi:hypothetical protein
MPTASTTVSPRADKSSGRLLDVRDVKAPLAQQALAYWESKRAGRLMPARADIRPGEIPLLLRNVIMLRVLRNPLDFEYVLVGNASVDALGFNLTKMKVSELDRISPGYSALLHAFHKIICDTRAPLGGWGRLVHVQREYRQFEGIYMPLSDDGETVDRIFAVAEYSTDAKFTQSLSLS